MFNGDFDAACFKLDFMQKAIVQKGPRRQGLSWRGGAIYISGNSNRGRKTVLKVVSCDFRSNAAMLRGGAMLLNFITELNISSSTFSNNMAVCQ